MEQRQISRLPSASIYHILICTVLVLAFLFVGIYPSQKSIESESGESVRLKAQIEEQKVLQPLFGGLLDRVRSFDTANSTAQTRTGLPSDQVDEISSIMGGIAQKYGFELVEATPDVKTMAKDSKSIAIRVVMRGKFLDFRKVLREVVELSYVEHIEELQIQETPKGKEFSLKMWLAIAGAKGDVKT